jgi:hypothetical protein
VQKSSFWGKTKDKESAPVVGDTRCVDELTQQLAEHKAALGLQAKEVEQLKLQLAMTTKLFEQGTCSVSLRKNLIRIFHKRRLLLTFFSKVVRSLLSELCWATLPEFLWKGRLCEAEFVGMLDLQHLFQTISSSWVYEPV